MDQPTKFSKFCSRLTENDNNQIESTLAHRASVSLSISPLLTGVLSLGALVQENSTIVCIALESGVVLSRRAVCGIDTAVVCACCLAAI